VGDAGPNLGGDREPVGLDGRREPRRYTPSTTPASPPACRTRRRSV
jgi:hypothetical protein